MAGKAGRPKLLETRSIDKPIQLSIEQVNVCEEKTKTAGIRSINSFIHEIVMEFCNKLSNKQLTIRDKTNRKTSIDETYNAFIDKINDTSMLKRQVADKLTQEMLDRKDHRDQKRLNKISLRMTFDEPKDVLKIEKFRNQMQIASRREKKERISKSGDIVQIVDVKD